jgi:hypothetical protein
MRCAQRARQQRRAQLRQQPKELAHQPQPDDGQ